MNESEPVDKHLSFFPKGNPGFKFYDFHKSPDGEDCLEKIYHYAKYTTIGGALFSFYEVVLNSRPSTMRGVIARFGRFTFPAAAMGITFGTSLCLLGKIRRKTDITNHCVSGVLAGTMWGVKYKSMHVGHTWSIILGVLAAYYMYFKVNNLPMLTLPPRDERRKNIPNMDFTIKVYDDPGRPDTMV